MASSDIYFIPVPGLNISNVPMIIFTRNIPTARTRIVLLSLTVFMVCPGFAPAMASAQADDDAGLLQSRQVWIQDRFSGESKLKEIPAPDTSLWNPARIDHHLDSLTAEIQPPMGVLVIEKIGLEVPVFNGTGDLVLDRGTGRILGTGNFYGEGNLGISGHRDGYFRGLKDLEIGDIITLRGVDGDQEFIVNNFSTVHKSNHEAIKVTDERMLTLVTCYPFYHVGHAPDRLLVQAVPVPSLQASGE